MHVFDMMAHFFYYASHMDKCLDSLEPRCGGGFEASVWSPFILQALRGHEQVTEGESSPAHHPRKYLCDYD